jgi:hypothetical protein
MKPDRKAQLATLLMIVALGSVALWKQGVFQKVAAAPAQPQDTIYETLDAVREGNLQKYLEAHTGGMETSLRRASAEIGEERLLKSLQERNAPVKGVAIQEPERVSDREVKAQVEYVFADRNELQIVYLERTGDRWKIARVDGTQRTEPVIPYGTPAN